MKNIVVYGTKRGVQKSMQKLLPKKMTTQS